MTRHLNVYRRDFENELEIAQKTDNQLSYDRCVRELDDGEVWGHLSTKPTTCQRNAERFNANCCYPGIA